MEQLGARLLVDDEMRQLGLGDGDVLRGRVERDSADEGDTEHDDGEDGARQLRDRIGCGAAFALAAPRGGARRRPASAGEDAWLVAAWFAGLRRRPRAIRPINALAQFAARSPPRGRGAVATAHRVLDFIRSESPWREKPASDWVGAEKVSLGIPSGRSRNS